VIVLKKYCEMKTWPVLMILLMTMMTAVVTIIIIVDIIIVINVLENIDYCGIEDYNETVLMTVLYCVTNDMKVLCVWWNENENIIIIDKWRVMCGVYLWCDVLLCDEIMILMKYYYLLIVVIDDEVLLLC